MSTKKPKEGGWGWVIVSGGFIVYTVVFGSLRCQSVFFIPIMDEFSADFSQVAWVSSIATGGLSLAGMLAAPLIMKLGYRGTVMLGGIVAALGTFSACFVSNLVLLYLTAGVLTGIGMGIAFVPSPVIIGYYFEKRRSFATNLASIGTSFGTLALCPLTQVIIDRFGLRGCFMIYAGLYLYICVAGALMRPPPAKKTLNDVKEVEEILPGVQNIEETEPLQELESTELNTKGCCTHPLMRNAAFIVYCVSQVVFLGGFICYQLYIVPFAVEEVGISRIKASLLLSIAAFIEIGSRILFGILGDVKRIDRIYLFAVALCGMSFCCFIMPFVKSYAALATVCAVSGLFQGGFAGISLVILVDVVGLEHYGLGLGISTCLNGIATLLAPPAVGLATDLTGKPSTALFISAGLLFLGSILSAAIKVTLKLYPPKLKSKR